MCVSCGFCVCFVFVWGGVLLFFLLVCFGVGGLFFVCFCCSFYWVFVCVCVFHVVFVFLFLFGGSVIVFLIGLFWCGGLFFVGFFCCFCFVIVFFFLIEFG